MLKALPDGSGGANHAGEQPSFFPLKEGRIEAWKPEREEQPDVFVKGIMRRSPENWTVTLFLVNGQQTPTRRE